MGIIEEPEKYAARAAFSWSLEDEENLTPIVARLALSNETTFGFVIGWRGTSVLNTTPGVLALEYTGFGDGVEGRESTTIVETVVPPSLPSREGG